MKTVFCYTTLICLVFIIGCNGVISDYDDTDVVAIVKGEVITVGDLRFLYPDDKILENLDGTIKAKLAVQTAKDMNLDVSQELQEMKNMNDEVGIYPQEEDHTESANDIREFARTQSAKLGMAPKEYYQKYVEQTQETSVYIVAYINELIGKPKDNSKEYTEKANRLLDDLVEKNEDKIQIFIK